MRHRWVRQDGKGRNWTCVCGCRRQVRSVRNGSGWGGHNSSDQTYYSTPDQQTRGTCTKTCPPCTRSET
jgi:hypothetical protein